MSVLEIKNLHVQIEDKKILKGVDLVLKLERSMPSWDQTVQGNQPCPLPSWVTRIMK